MPEPIVGPADGGDPEHEALLGDQVGLALLVVLDALGPAERIAFVLHDLFAVPFDEIAPIVGRSPAATRQLASRARRRVKDARAVPDPDRALQRRVVDAFLAAARARRPPAAPGPCSTPTSVLRADFGSAAAARFLRGASDVAGSATMFARAGIRSAGRRSSTAPRAPSRSATARSYAVLGFTVQRRADRRDRHPRRPRAAGRARPVAPRLTRRAPICCTGVEQSDPTRKEPS